MRKENNTGWALFGLILSTFSFFEWVKKYLWAFNLILWFILIPCAILYKIWPDWQYIGFYYLFMIILFLILAIIKYSSIASKIEDDIERKLRNGE